MTIVFLGFLFTSSDIVAVGCIVSHKSPQTAEKLTAIDSRYPQWRS